MNTFEFIQENFARYVLPELSNDSVTDCKRAFTMNHLLTTGKYSRLTGWAMIQQGTTFVQSKLAANHKNLITADSRTRYEAWLEGLENFKGPTCFMQFTQSAVNISNVFLTVDLRVVRICGPSSCETFNYLSEPDAFSQKAHKVLDKLRKKHAV